MVVTSEAHVILALMIRASNGALQIWVDNRPGLNKGADKSRPLIYHITP